MKEAKVRQIRAENERKKRPSPAEIRVRMELSVVLALAAEVLDDLTRMAETDIEWPSPLAPIIEKLSAAINLNEKTQGGTMDIGLKSRPEVGPDSPPQGTIRGVADWLEGTAKQATHMAEHAPNEPAQRAWLRLADAAWAIWNGVGAEHTRVLPLSIDPLYRNDDPHRKSAALGGDDDTGI